MTHAEYVQELATRITTSERTYEQLAEQYWRAYDTTAAVRYRAMAEGLAMARDHMLAIAQESRSSVGGTATSGENP